MCGRYRIKDTDVLTAHLRLTFGIPDWVKGPARYNIAPSLDCPVLIMDEESDVPPIPYMMRWGFMPFWQKPEDKKFEVNARSEGITTKPKFREAVKKRRCLVPADGFYEWRRDTPKVSYPFDFHLRGDRPFVMAGIYEKATQLRPATFCLLTTGPNAVMAPIHDRMPVILEPEKAKRWLTRERLTEAEQENLTAPYAGSDMEAVPISTLVNSPKNDAPEVLERVMAPPPKQTQAELF